MIWSTMAMIPVIGIILNAIIAVLVVGYGIWLRNIFEHQLKAKDSTIESYEAIIKIHESEVSRLKAEATPAIVNAYQTVRNFADEMADTNSRLTVQINELKSNTIQQVPGLQERLRAEGFLVATGMFQEAIKPITTTEGHKGSVVTANDFLKAIQTFASDVSNWMAVHTKELNEFTQLAKKSGQTPPA